MLQACLDPLGKRQAILRMKPGKLLLADRFLGLGLLASAAGLLAALDRLFKSLLEDDIGDGEIEFKSDNTYVADFGDDPDTGKWSYDSSTGYLTIDSDDPDEDIQMILVKSISSSTLVIEQSETIEGEIDQGVTVEIDAIIEMTLSKSS